MNMVTLKKAKMCTNKVSFRSKDAARRVAEKYNQSVYECPICFCYHCTSKENWKQEYVPVQKFEKLLESHEQLTRTLAKHHGIIKENQYLKSENKRLLDCLNKHNIKIET